MRAGWQSDWFGKTQGGLPIGDGVELLALGSIAGGTAADAELVREGVRVLQRELEGAALKHEYQRHQTALMDVDRRIRRFFGPRRGDQT